MRRTIWFGLGLGCALALARTAPLPPPAGSPALAEEPTAPALVPVAAADPTPIPAPVPVEPEVPPPIARHVIIVSEDGLRPDALLLAHAPTHTALMKRGAYSLRAQTMRKASTLPSHASMLSGFDVGRHGLHWNSWKPDRGYIQVPTVFDPAEDAGLGAAAFVGKKKLRHIAQPGSVDFFSRPGYYCRKVVAEAATYFVTKKPQVMFVHFSDPDESGHSDGWMSADQMRAIRETDRCLTTLVDAVGKSDLEKSTLFILSADHGGHGHNHSGRNAEDRIIPWLAWGAGVKQGHQIVADISTVDTAATTLWALGHPTHPAMMGRPVTEAFE